MLGRDCQELRGDAIPVGRLRSRTDTHHLDFRGERRTVHRQAQQGLRADVYGALSLEQDAVGVHSKALLRLSVGGSPFAAEIEVMRVGAAPQPSDGYRIAAQFLAITPKHRQLIERFISQ